MNERCRKVTANDKFKHTSGWTQKVKFYDGDYIKIKACYWSTSLLIVSENLYGLIDRPLPTFSPPAIHMCFAGASGRRLPPIFLCIYDSLERRDTCHLRLVILTVRARAPCVLRSVAFRPLQLLVRTWLASVFRPFYLELFFAMRIRTCVCVSVCLRRGFCYFRWCCIYN